MEAEHVADGHERVEPGLVVARERALHLGEVGRGDPARRDRAALEGCDRALARAPDGRLTIAVAGCRTCSVATEMPIPELTPTTRDLDARAVGVSVSTATRGAGIVARLRELRRLVPARIALWVGGEGVPQSLARATMTRSLTDLSRRAAALRA